MSGRPPPGKRVSQQQLARLDEQLSERDRAVLASIRAFRLMTAAHLERLHFADHASEDTARRVARRTLRRLHRHRLLKRLERRIGGLRAGSAGFIYGLTPLGHRLLELGESDSLRRKRWREPSAGFVAHTLAIAELGSLAVRLALDEGQEVLDLQPEPEAWRVFHDGHQEQILKADLMISLADASTERSWFVEVDLDTESRTVISAKCLLYGSYWRSGVEQERFGVFPRVLWVAPNEQRASGIASTFTRPGVEPRLFAVTTADQAALLLAGLHEKTTNHKGDSS